MMRIVFLTDIHFGRLTDGALPALENYLNKVPPDLILLGGDITQRAFQSQYHDAAAFIARLPAPHMCVVGNHDLPAWNLAERFMAPYHVYKKHITFNLMPSFRNQQVAVLGLNSARRWLRDGTWAQGKIDDYQINAVKDFFAAVPETCVKMVMVHHPLTAPVPKTAKLLVRNHAAALLGFADAGVDMVLTGHLHKAAAHIYGANLPRSMAMVQGGTATCDRLRGEPNSFYEIALQGSTITTTLIELQQGAFVPATDTVMHRTQNGWAYYSQSV